MTKEQAIYNFWNSFDIDAYPNTSVPKNATLPYISYEVRTDAYGNLTNCAASIWFKTTSEAKPNALVDKIAKYIADVGALLKCDDGYIQVLKGSPWCINQNAEDDDSIKLRQLNVQYIFYTI